MATPPRMRTDPPVKSNPYAAGKRRRRRVELDHLWPGSWWKKLCEQAQADHETFDAEEYPISPACLDLIVEFNARLADR